MGGTSDPYCICQVPRLANQVRGCDFRKIQFRILKILGFRVFVPKRCRASQVKGAVRLA